MILFGYIKMENILGTELLLLNLFIIKAIHSESEATIFFFFFFYLILNHTKKQHFWITTNIKFL